MLILIATLGSVAFGSWRALRVRREPPDGVRLSRTAAPALWAMLDDLATIAHTRPPDAVFVVGEVNAMVEERARLLGLIGGPRYLSIGLPLLQFLTVEQLRAVLAHELGHYSGQETRFAAIAYRGGIMLRHTVRMVGDTRLVSGPFQVVCWLVALIPTTLYRLYYRMFQRVQGTVRQRQELLADQAAVRAAGAAAVADGLRDLYALDQAFDFYHAQYLSYGLSRELLPDDVFGGFVRMVAARPTGYARWRAQAGDDEKPSPVDSHPTLRARLAAIGDPAPATSKPVPALTLVPADLPLGVPV